jgi:hypothetical protein
VIRSFSSCVAPVTKAKEINAIDACSRRERSIGGHLYWMEMNPDGVCHKVVYGCGKFVSAKHTYGSSALLGSWVEIAKIGAQEDCSWLRGS